MKMARNKEPEISIKKFANCAPVNTMSFKVQLPAVMQGGSLRLKGAAWICSGLTAFPAAAAWAAAAALCQCPECSSGN